MALDAVVAVAREELGYAPSDEEEDRLARVSLDEIDATMGHIASEVHQPIEDLLVLAERQCASNYTELYPRGFSCAGAPRDRGPPAGWVIADVAPERVLDPPGEPPDPQLQRLLGEMARGSSPLADAPEPPRPMAQVVRGLVGPGAWGLLYLALAVLAFFVLMKLWRRIAPRIVPRPRLIYRAALDRLSEDGLAREWGESPEAFAARVRARVPALMPLTDGHLAAAFGRGLDARALGRMMTESATLTSELRRSIPWWRRVLGLANPFSWLLSR
jgi:hypothetical protein